jgi:ribosomal protein S18 acetylase RimI-like enzyme
MEVTVIAESAAAIPEYARISIAFMVQKIADIHPDGAGGFILIERPIERPYVKDYDAFAPDHPQSWVGRFDLTNWTFLAAMAGGRRVGCAAIARDSPDVTLLENRKDLAILWDLRVDPEYRQRGVGSALFRTTEALAIAAGCRELKIETQDTNVPACRFYARQGCVLRACNAGVYPEQPDEIQLLWYKDLARKA